MATAGAPPWLRLTDGGILAAVIAITCAHPSVDSAGLAIALAFGLAFVLTSSWYSLEVHTVNTAAIVVLAYPLFVLAATFSRDVALSSEWWIVGFTRYPGKFLGVVCAA
jgi:hypothetical protein